MKKALLGAIASCALALSLAACSAEPEVPVETGPEAPEGISVSDGRLNLPAASGNPAAVYFTLTNASDEAQMLRTASVQGAENALIHATTEYEGRLDMYEVTQVPVPAGESVVFEPGGTHVMVMGLEDGLEPGGEVEVTLTFARGDKVSFPARVLAPGDDGSGN